jgi:hypothetical protein
MVRWSGKKCLLEIDSDVSFQVIPNLPGFDVSPERYDTMLGKAFRTGSAHIVTLGPIRVAGGHDKLDAFSLDAKHALAERRYR